MNNLFFSDLIISKDLTSLGSFAHMGLIGLVIASLINLFLRSAALDFAVSFIGVGVFIILTAYDTQKLKSIYYTMNGNTARAGNIAIYGALTYQSLYYAAAFLWYPKK